MKISMNFFYVVNFLTGDIWNKFMMSTSSLMCDTVGDKH